MNLNQHASFIPGTIHPLGHAAVGGQREAEGDGGGELGIHAASLVAGMGAVGLKGFRSGAARGCAARIGRVRRASGDSGAGVKRTLARSPLEAL